MILGCDTRCRSVPSSWFANFTLLLNSYLTGTAATIGTIISCESGYRLAFFEQEYPEDTKRRDTI